MVSRIRQCSAIGPICRSMRYSGKTRPGCAACIQEEHMFIKWSLRLVTTVQKTWEKECGQMQIKHMKWEQVQHWALCLADMGRLQAPHMSAGWSTLSQTTFSTTTCSSQVMSKTSPSQSSVKIRRFQTPEVKVQQYQLQKTAQQSSGRPSCSSSRESCEVFKLSEEGCCGRTSRWRFLPLNPHCLKEHFGNWNKLRACLSNDKSATLRWSKLE